MEMENQPQNPEFRNDPEYFLIIISSSTLKQSASQNIFSAATNDQYDIIVNIITI